MLALLLVFIQRYVIEKWEVSSLNYLNRVISLIDVGLCRFIALEFIDDFIAWLFIPLNNRTFVVQQ